MNKYYMLSLVDETIKTVGAVHVPYERHQKDSNRHQVYNYLTKMTDLKPGDQVLVPYPEEGLGTGGQGFMLVCVVEIHEEAKIDENSDFEYKWVASRFDSSTYDELLATAKRQIDRLDSFKKQKQRESAIAALNEDLGEDGIKLLNSGKDE